MADIEILQRYHLTEMQLSQIKSHLRGEYNILDDDSLMFVLVHFAKNCHLQDPYYKFMEVIYWVKGNNYVHISDLEILDEYYHMNIIRYILSGRSEYYLGKDVRTKRQLENNIGDKNKDFDFSMFRLLLCGML